MKTNRFNLFVKISGGLSVATISRIICTVFVMTFLAGFSAQAAYLENVPQTITQPDGTILKCFATGDEYHHWLHDANHFTIVQDTITGFYVYAQKSGSKLVPTSYIAGVTDPSTTNLQPGVNLDATEVAVLRREQFKAPNLKGSSTVNTTGTINNIVIFIRFSDQSEFATPASSYNAAFNATGTVSMNQYFQEVTGSQLTINTSLFPKDGSSTTASYQDTKTRKYYCKYNVATNTEGYQNDNERYDREGSLLKNATEAVKSQIESSGLDFDNDKNGQVDNVCYIIQGATDGWSDLLWPHMFMLYASNVTIGNARVWNYNLQLSETFNVSVLCHEMSHSLGFPDLYRYTNNSINPVSSWDIMASTTNPPQHPSVYQKQKYGNWTSIPEISTNGTYSLKPLSSDPFAAFRINSPNSTSEYFMVEYRKTSGLFESQLLGSGLIIYRVNPSINGNSFGPPDEVYVCRPDGTTTANGDLAQAFFSADCGRTSFGSSSRTTCFLSDGSAGGFQITNIGTAGSTISFTVTFGNEPSPILTLAPASREIAATSATTTFTVSNTGGGTMTWTAAVTSGASWARITTGASGSNSGSIAVSADPNPESTPRNAVITVTAAGVTGSPKTLSISQAANSAVLKITPESQEMQSGGGTGTFIVSNTGGGTMRWNAEVTTGSNWARLTSGNSGSNTGSIVLSVDANPESAIRTAVIIVSATDASGSPKTISITQAANESVLSVSPEMQTVAFGSSTATFTVSNTGGGTMGWTSAVSSGSEWAQITSGSEGSNSGSILVSMDTNTGSTARTATITITARDAKGGPKTVTIHQSANESLLSVSPENQSMDFSAGTTSFNVSNIGGGSMTWTTQVASGSNWAHISAGTNGNNQGSIVVSVDANTESTPRTATIIIEAQDALRSNKTLTIVQSANESVLNAGPESQPMPFTGGVTSFAVSNSGGGTMNWSAAVSEGSDWAHITSGQNGRNNGLIMVSADNNPYNNIREAVITVFNNDNQNNQQTLRITQEANKPVLTVDRQSHSASSSAGQTTINVSNAGGGTISWEAAVTNGESWARITSGSKGTNSSEIRLDFDANTGTERTAFVTIIANDGTGARLIVSLTQQAQAIVMEIDPDFQMIDFSGGNLNFGVSVNGTGTIDWNAEVTSGPSWVHITSGTSGTNNGLISVEVDANTGDARTGVITITSTDPSTPAKTLTISQDLSNGVNVRSLENNMIVYPNPAANTCTVQMEDFNGMARQLEVYNMMGQVESTQTLNQERTLVDISNLPQGVYLFRVLSENNILSQRRVVKN